MTDEELEKRLADEIRGEKPDMLDGLLAELDEQPASASSDEEKAAGKPVRKTVAYRWQKAALSIAAVLLIFVGTALLLNRTGETAAVIGLDVNPGIEISIDKNEKVLGAEAVNEDGGMILDGMDLKGSDVNTAVNAVIGSMLTKGYLTRDVNSVLVSVRASDEKRGREIEDELAGRLSSFIEDSEISGAILSQYVEDDPEVREFAEKNGISLGKAWLIRNLLSSGSRHMDEESLLKLSTQELILLGEERHVKNEKAYGKPSTSKYIGKKRAEDTALARAGVSRAQVTELETEFDCEGGVIIYEVEFTAGGVEYEYEIDAETGKIIGSGAGDGFDDEDDDDEDDFDEDEADDEDDDDEDDD